jgi:hypothetical protein
LLAVPSSTIIDVKLEHCWNAFEPIDVTEAGMVIDVKPEPWNAFEPIVVTELGMIIDVKFEQS